MTAADIKPPPLEDFRAWAKPAGAGRARIEIATVAVEFEGLPDLLGERMAAAYAPYLSAPSGRGRPLRVRAYEAPVEYFILPGFAKGYELYRMATALEKGVFRTVSYRLASWIDVDRREGALAFARGELDPAPRALENFLRSSVAWLAVDAGGFFLHGASIVRNGRGHLFYGPSGAGKSTLAALSDQGEVVSDDLSLLLKTDTGLALAGGPFRGTYTQGSPVVGTFPVAGFFRLRKSDRVEVAPDDGRCFADLLGNLPFVVDQLPRHAHLIDRVRSLVDGVPLRYLHFRRDAPFWPAIDAASGRKSEAAK